jgi:hypothetical protein
MIKSIPYSSPRMSYTALPTEILNLISSHLDITSAIALAQTSSFSHQAAESRIWGSITVDHVDRFQPIDEGVKVPLIYLPDPLTALAIDSNSIFGGRTAIHPIA